MTEPNLFTNFRKVKMSNDPRDLNGSKLREALLELGRDESLRSELMDWLKLVERKMSYCGSIRDEITGPIIDALHSEDDLYEKELIDGTKFRFLYRTKIARDFLLAGLENPSHVWEPQTTRILQYFAEHSNGDVLIGGAYFGDHAILLAKQLQKDGRKVHCFEPNSAQSSMLDENAKLNGLDNVKIQKLGLWDASSHRLKLAGFDSFANAIESSHAEEGFGTVKIDEYCAKENCTLGIVMLDIEGSEFRALQGAQSVLKRDKPAVVFEVHRDYVDWSNGLLNTSICAYLSDLGYHLFALRDFNSNQEMGDLKIELVPADKVYLEGPFHGFNMIAVTDKQLISAPLFSIVENVSPKLLRHKDPSLHHPLQGLPD